MRLRYSWLLLCLAAACTSPVMPIHDGPGPTHLTPGPTLSPGPDPALAADPGPVVAGPIGIVEGFDLVTIATDVTSPVAAVTPDGMAHYAYLAGEYAWPFVASMGGGAPVPLPGAQMTTTAVTMVASADGTLHLAWDADRQIRYVRRYADGSFSEPVVVGQVPSREPTLALTSAGEVVLAWTHDTPPEGEESRAPQVYVAVGSAEPIAFGEPRTVNAGCCVGEFGDVADRMSGPSLALGPDDAIHIVYEWSTWSNTTIDYVAERGDAFSAPVRISNAAFVPCPALMVDEEGAHITYLREFEPSVYYRRVADGIASDELAIYTPDDGRVTMSMAVRDAEGVLHLGVTEDGAVGRLRYLRVSDPGGPVDELAVAPDGIEGRFELTPRAGGMLVAPGGELVFSYLSMPRGDVGTTAQLAFGR